MAEMDPTETSLNDLCIAILKESGVVGTGQTPLKAQIIETWSRVQWMLQQWGRKRFMVYHLVTYFVAPSTGAVSYSIGPGGAINTDVPASPWNFQFGPQFGPGTVVGKPSKSSARPDKIESAFLRQITQSQPNWIDYPLKLLQSMEDYNRIALKNLVSFPGWIFYDPAWPLGQLYPWPVMQANIYALGVTIKEQLPVSFPNLAALVNLPYEYYACILYNGALRMRSRYSIPSFAGDPLPGLAADAMATVRGANTAIAALSMPTDVVRPGIYNVFSDRSY